MLSVFECLKIVGIFFDPLLFYDIFFNYKFRDSVVFRNADTFLCMS